MTNIKYILPITILYLFITGCSADSAAEDSHNPSAQSAQCNPGTALGMSDAGLNRVRLCIDVQDGKNTLSPLPFDVEVAASLEEQNKGLMFRTTLADDKGMIFPYATPRILSFWMKNTVISLDIIFIDEGGNIVNIAQNTEPYSTDPVSSDNLAIAVLELRAGLTQELNIKKGDIIRWKPVNHRE